MLVKAYGGRQMPANSEKPALPASAYQIEVEGKIDPSWSDWLGGAQLASQKRSGLGPKTTLRVRLADQAALRGLLNRLWDLNLVVISIRRIEPPGNRNRNKEKK
jgi:hypothetical protein